MNLNCAKRICLALGLAVGTACGCNRNAGPPPPLAAGEIPVAMERGFSKAAPDVKEVVGQVVSAVQSKDYPKAATVAQALSERPDLTSDQRLLVARAMLALNGLLQSAQAQGDADAAAALKFHQMTK